MSKNGPPDRFVAALGKTIELATLDDFIWATLHGWGTLPAVKRILIKPKPSLTISEALESAQSFSERVQSEERADRLVTFTEGESAKRFPYLFSLAAVRLWALIEAAAREVLVEAFRRSSDLEPLDGLDRVRVPISDILFADDETRAEHLADAIWGSSESRQSGIERLDSILGRIGLGGRCPGVVVEILRELSEVRHCVVHRGDRADDRLLRQCPWIIGSRGAPLPATLDRYWLYRTATYWYVTELTRRWTNWRRQTDIEKLSAHLRDSVYHELTEEWRKEKSVLLKNDPSADIATPSA